MSIEEMEILTEDSKCLTDLHTNRWQVSGQKDIT